jgi:hypothetical protein
MNFMWMAPREQYWSLSHDDDCDHGKYDENESKLHNYFYNYGYSHHVTLVCLFNSIILYSRQGSK